MNIAGSVPSNMVKGVRLVSNIASNIASNTTNVDNNDRWRRNEECDLASDEISNLKINIQWNGLDYGEMRKIASINNNIHTQE